MQIQQTYSYRHAEAIIEKEFPQERAEILEVISSVQWTPLAQPKTRRRGRMVLQFTINQIATNTAFNEEFKNRGWGIHPLIVSTSDSRLVADFKKGVIQIEVQFGNMAR